MRCRSERSGAAECFGGVLVADGIERRVYTPGPRRQGEIAEFVLTST
jgi:hypothetical protein